MIVTEANDAKAGTSTSKDVEILAPPKPGESSDPIRDDPPPTYTDIPEPNDTVPDVAPPSPLPRATPRRTSSGFSGLPAQRPTNFVSVSKVSGSVKGTWVVDPAIVIPTPLLPALYPGETEATRRNFFLKTNNGAIVAEVTMIPRALAKDGRQRVTFGASTLNGAVRFTFHEAKTDEVPAPPRMPFKLAAESLNGAISVTIPRSFRGIIFGATFNGSVKLSDAVNAQVMYEKADGMGRRIFVGDFDQDDFAEGNEWLGDEVDAKTKSGNIKIRYEDEGETAPDEGVSNKARSQGLFSKMWGAMF